MRLSCRVPHALLCVPCFRSNTWTNAPKQPRQQQQQQQGWGGGGGGGEGWGNGGDLSSSYRGGSSNHWGDGQKGGGGGGGGGSGAWDSDGDRSGCWSDPSRGNNANSGGGGGNAWTGSGNTPDQANHNQGSNSWGDPNGPKPNPQGRGQGWGEPPQQQQQQQQQQQKQQHHHGNQNWGEPASKPSNASSEWGKGPEPMTRGGQGPTKTTGDAFLFDVVYINVGAGPGTKQPASSTPARRVVCRLG